MTEYDLRRRRSVSQLKSYTRCGMAYKLEKLDKHPSPPAAWTVKGSAVHNTIEKWERSDRKADVETSYRDEFADIVRHYQQKYPDLTQWIKTPRVKTTEQDLKLREAEGLGHLRTYTSRAEAEEDLWSPARLPDGQIAAELPFKIDFGSEVPFFLVGYIDVVKYWRADGTLTIGDYKTGSPDREDYRQLGTYRVGLQETYGIDTTFGEYWYTKLDRSSGWIDLTRYDKPYLERMYSQLDQGIENKIFLPNPSLGSKGICTFCAVKPYCPEMKGR